MTEKICTLERIKEVLNDGLPHCALAELNRWTAQNGITAEAAELGADIEFAIADSRAEWDKFLSEVKE